MANEEMSWVAGRWVRKISAKRVPAEYRKQHWVSPRQLAQKYPDLVTDESRSGSKKAANQFWHDLQAEIRKATVEREPTLEDLWDKATGPMTRKEHDLFLQLLQEKLEPARQLLGNNWPSVEDLSPHQLDLMTATINTALNDDLPAQRQVATQNTYHFWRDKWLDSKQSENLKENSTNGFSPHLKHLERHLGGANISVETINEAVLESFKVVVGGKVKAGEISATYAANIFRATVKPFVKYLVKNRAIPMPLNIDDLWYTPDTPNPQPMEIADARKLLAGAEGPMKIYLMLMFQCGYTQKDISDLKPAQVDWQAGRLKRKRSKEEDEKKVPVVDYKLWPEVFDGLKEYGNKTGDSLFLHNGEKLLRRRSDTIAYTFADLAERLSIQATPKMIRKTTANILYAKKAYGPYTYYYCGWSPSGVADRNYLIPPLKIQDEMTAHLRKVLLV